MKNHHFLICILLSLTSLSLFAQEKSKLADGVKYSMGEPYPRAFTNHKVSFNLGDYLLNVKYEGKRIILQKFRVENMFLEKVSNLNFDYEKGIIKKFEKLNDKVLMFYSRYDKSSSSEQLLCQEIDIERCTLSGKEIEVLRVERKLKRELISTGFSEFYYWFEKSKDEKKFLVYYEKKDEMINDARSFLTLGLNVLDDGLNKIWSREVKMPYSEKKMKITDCILNNHGDVYLGTKVFFDRKEKKIRRKEGKAEYNVEVYKYSSKGKEKTLITLEKKHLGEFRLYEDVNGDIICVSFYSSVAHSVHSDGIVIFKLAKEGSLKGTKSYKIPVQVMNRYASKREVKRNNRLEVKGKAQFENLKLTEVKVNKDGSILITGEQQYFETTTYSSTGGNSTSSTEYFFNDILISKINGNGELIWINKLPKNQKGKRWGGGMSYKFLETSEAYYYLYLDNLKNENLYEDKEPKFYVDKSKGFLIAYKVNKETGKFDRVILLNLRDVDRMKMHMFNPKRVINVGNNSFMFEVHLKKKQDALIRIDY